MNIGRRLRSMAVVLVLIPGLVSLGPIARDLSGLALAPAQEQVLAAPESAVAQIAPGAPLAEAPPGPDAMAPASPSAYCTDSPTGNDSNPLDECQGTSFILAGNTWDLSVYYTLDTGAGNDWILTHTQVTPIVGWMQEAYEAYYEQTGLTYGDSICGRHIRAKVMKGDGWSGIAWWPNSCYIGLDAPMIRGNGGKHTTMHEMRHKVVQFAYPNCLTDWRPDYPGNTTYIVEGDADYGPSTVGDFGYMNSGYNQSKSLNQHGYNNLFAPYYSEHIDLYAGPFGSPGDPDYLAGGILKHWDRCEALADLHVVRDVVQAYTPYTAEEFFTNFFAALYLHAYADPVTQPELYFFEEDAPGVSLTYSPPLAGSASLSGGSQSWTGVTTPDTWAGRTYEIVPQAGCDYVMLEGSGTGKLGWAYMAVDTSAPSTMYSAWVGTGFNRVFAGHGVYDKIGVSVIAFDHNYDYDLTATCVTPQITLLEPKQTNFALVGDPTSPIAFLGRVRVTSGTTPVRGLVEEAFSFDAGGDAVTIVTDTLQEVGSGEYWATLLPPTKPAGTTFVNLEACLDTTCTSETNALLYVAPGNSDIMILHDESGSMSTADVTGEGTRLENAQKAAAVWANLTQAGDRYGVMGFNAKDNPGGCGLPSGSGDCELDIRTHMPRTSITNPGTQIPTIEGAINATAALDWTPIGAGLVAAKDALKASPTGTNPKYIILLSDGEENVNPLYGEPASGVQQEIMDSGVIVHTIGFSGDSPSALLSQIAADTGGIYRYVPTSPGDALVQSRQAMSAEALATSLAEDGVSPDGAAALAGILAPTSIHYPANLGLADTYDFFETEAQGATRIGAGMHVLVTSNEWREQQVTVDASANVLRLVSAGRQWDADVDGVCEGYHRQVQVLQPNASPRDWIPVSPPTQDNPPPGTWDIRNSYYVDVVLVPNPQPGLWKIRTKYYYQICLQDEAAPTAPQALESDFLMNISVQSTIRLEGRFLEPFEDNQGRTGDHVPIVAALMQKTGTLTGATVLARVDKPGAGFDIIQLYDDGNHGDGKANDGIYGRVYPKTTMEGPYNVLVAAYFPDPAGSGQTLIRTWYGSFYALGDHESQDDDPFPWWWEREHPCMDPDAHDSPQADYDKDGLDNQGEWENGTNPCDPDTDDGGEADGSEVSGGRDPHWPADDKVPIIPAWSLRPLNQAFLVRWSRPLSYTNMLIWVTLPGGGEEPIDAGQTGTFTVTAENGMIYGVRLQGFTQDAVGGPVATGGPTAPETVEPKADPDAPSGAVLINYDAISTTIRAVELYVSATDVPLEGPTSQPSGALASPWTEANEISGDVEMRFRNGTEPGWTDWAPYESSVPWELPASCPYGANCTVFAQFRDAALNESEIVADSILLARSRLLYLPMLMRAGP